MTPPEAFPAARLTKFSRIPLRRTLWVYLALLVPVMALMARYDPYNVDGDAVAYMDIADLLQAHRWAGAVNGYWHPLYPSLLAAAQAVLHPARTQELGAYYAVNWVIFFAQVAAMLAFVTALVRLRDSMGTPSALLPLNALRLLGMALLVIATQRELAFADIRPDGLLQALLLAAMAAMLQMLATNRMVYAPLMGAFFGLAYLTKSFAFLVALLAMMVLVAFQWFIQRRSAARALLSVALALLAFAAIAGPYVAALSHQKHRLTFGDSGALNYAWYVGGTEKMHLEPWMTADFGSSDVHLLHPEQQLLAARGPQGLGVYSYRALSYGTYPVWFDATYFNERIQPHIRPEQLARRDARNIVLVFRYLFNHPEPLILMGVLGFAGAALRRDWRLRWWWPSVGLGVAMWAIYGLVNVEERYVTVAYLLILLPIFAGLVVPGDEAARKPRLFDALTPPALRSCASAVVLLLAFLAMGETLRQALDLRRQESITGRSHGWEKPQIFGAAAGLAALGVQPGAEIACIGTTACLYDPYWARLAGVRVLTEIYAPNPRHLIAQLDADPDRERAYEAVRAQGASVLVGHFDPGEMNASHPAAAGWLRLGETEYYALPLAPAGRNEVKP